MSETHTASTCTRRPARRRVLVVCAGTLAVATAFIAGCSDQPAPSIDQFAPEPSPSAALPALPALTPIACHTSSAAPGETVTRGPGSQDSPIAAVAAYHYAVITDRDASQVAATVAPKQDMGKPQLIQAALDGFPPGTTYCLRMRQTDPTTVLATLDYQPPGAPAAQYKLRATTTGPPGQIRIAGEIDQ
ncbi:hypothetical protein [uncultured Williamsia sp.]|uniref:hypothetical protein n=1 Tax=uncultured Williamsia sp. TaxID=259311 RepID=UPI00260E0C16|nr:hypothetical protein [uncultured Williamsia sp.]